MRYRIPPRLGYVVHEPTPEDPTARVYLMHLPDGEPLMLAASAALIWALAADGEPEVPGALADLLGESVAEVGPATRTYLDTLVEQGLLTETPEGDEAPEGAAQ